MFLAAFRQNNLVCVITVITNLLNSRVIFDSLVVQPISSCNLNCRYCYLPDRKKRHVISMDVVERVKELVLSFNSIKKITWHCGEPLLIGARYFREILDVFYSCDLTHEIQTNATLISDDWCHLFKDFNVEIGVSVDGDSIHNKDRVFWNGAESFDHTLIGIDKLKKSNIPFSIICVINENNIHDPRAVYSFLADTGCQSVAFNIEEQENFNTKKIIFPDGLISEFWECMFNSWKDDMRIRVREIDDCLHALLDSSSGYSGFLSDPALVLLPTVSYKGDVVVLSPEFLGAKSNKYNDFKVGNVLDSNFHQVLDSITAVGYVKDYVDGLEKCKNSCEYFDFCGGGYASNKYFENGDLTSTATDFCNYSRRKVIDAVLKLL